MSFTFDELDNLSCDCDRRRRQDLPFLPPRFQLHNPMSRVARPPLHKVRAGLDIICVQVQVKGTRPILGSSDIKKFISLGKRRRAEGERLSRNLPDVVILIIIISLTTGLSNY